MIGQTARAQVCDFLHFYCLLDYWLLLMVTRLRRNPTSSSCANPQLHLLGSLNQHIRSIFVIALPVFYRTCTAVPVYYSYRTIYSTCTRTSTLASSGHSSIPCTARIDRQSHMALSAQEYCRCHTLGPDLRFRIWRQPTNQPP